MKNPDKLFRFQGIFAELSDIIVKWSIAIIKKLCQVAH
jgi:hypothetical protein